MTDARAIVLTLLVFQPLAGAPARPGEAREAREWLQELACAGPVRRQLEAWHATGEAVRHASAGPDAPMWRLPTEEPGTWIVATIEGAMPALTHVNSGRISRVTFDAACNPARRVRPRTRPAHPLHVFDDEDVRALLASQQAGAIYVWSPHMPLSVDGYHRVMEAARGLDVVVTPLLDPSADREYARAVAEAAGLPREALRPFASLELEFRNASLHAPSVLVYRAGRIAGLAVPGYRKAAGYRAVIESRLGRARGAPN